MCPQKVAAKFHLLAARILYRLLLAMSLNLLFYCYNFYTRKKRRRRRRDINMQIKICIISYMTENRMKQYNNKSIYAKQEEL